MWNDPVESRRPPTVRPYEALASVYDLVMDHVDYEEWAAYIRSLLADFHAEPETVLEMGCGTGSFALEFDRLLDCTYHATDGSPEMIRVAREKASLFGADVEFSVAQFSSLDPEPAYDLILLLYDGVNYLLTASEIEKTFRRVLSALRPKGMFIFDQSTPANSVNNADVFEDSGKGGHASYVRRSRFDVETGLHHTSFDLVIEGEAYREHHVQRAYTVEEMTDIIRRAGFEVVESFEDFTRTPASSASERVQWLLRAA